MTKRNAVMIVVWFLSVLYLVADKAEAVPAPPEPSCMQTCVDTTQFRNCAGQGNGPCTKFEQETCIFCDGVNGNCKSPRLNTAVCKDVNRKTTYRLHVSCDHCPCTLDGHTFDQAEAWSLTAAFGMAKTVPLLLCTTGHDIQPTPD